jgi:hypothetical protein
MANFIMGIISLSIGIVLLSSVFITTVKAANTTNTPCYNSSGMLTTCSWSTAEIALWGLLTIVGIAGLVYGVLNVFGLA